MRKISTILVALMMITAFAACGDDDAAESTTAEPTTASTAAPTGDTGGTADDDTADDTTEDDTSSSGDMMGDSYADVTVGGETIRFHAGDITFSPIEGVQDITFEECDPAFFSVGFWVVGYPLDADGVPLLEDDLGNLAGSLVTTIPFEGTDPELLEFDFEIEYTPLDLDARYRAETGTVAYEFDGNRVSGTATLDQFGDPVDISFDIVCAG